MTMGKKSKFPLSFLQRHPPRNVTSPTSNVTSKAQRILGAETLDLNIDSGKAEDRLWRRYAGSRTRYMSFLGPDSTKPVSSIPRSGSACGEVWDKGTPGLGKPRFLDPSFGENIETHSSNSSDKVDSSTIPPYYDTLELPVETSLQTVERSARDSAVEKDNPQLIPINPQIHLRNPTDNDVGILNDCESEMTPLSAARLSRGLQTKFANLDFSVWIPKPLRPDAKTSDPTNQSTLSLPSAAPATSLPPNSCGRRLMSVISKDSLKFAKPKIIERTRPQIVESRLQSDKHLSQLYDHYEQLHAWPTQIQETPDYKSAPSSQQCKLRYGISASSPNLRASVSSSDKETTSICFPNPKAVVSPVVQGSATSISSHTTKKSKHSYTSMVNASDMNNMSVPSLISDSEDDSENLTKLETSLLFYANAEALQALTGKTQPIAAESRPRPSQGRRQCEEGARGRSQSQGRRKRAAQMTPFITIPEVSKSQLKHSRPGSTESRQSDVSCRSCTQLSIEKAGKDVTKATYPESKKSSMQRTPPLSPSSVEFRRCSQFSWRFIAVSDQEKLLERTRQSSNTVNKESLDENQSPRLSPQVLSSIISKFSTVSAASMFAEESSRDMQELLLRLDTEVADAQHLYSSPVFTEAPYSDSDEDGEIKCQSMQLPNRRNRLRSASLISDSLTSLNSPITPCIMSAKTTRPGLGALKTQQKGPESGRMSSSVPSVNLEERSKDNDEFLMHEFSDVADGFGWTRCF